MLTFSLITNVYTAHLDSTSILTYINQREFMDRETKEKNNRQETMRGSNLIRVERRRGIAFTINILMD